jgi:hypothetical protein
MPTHVLTKGGHYRPLPPLPAKPLAPLPFPPSERLATPLSPTFAAAAVDVITQAREVVDAAIQQSEQDARHHYAAGCANWMATNWR